MVSRGEAKIEMIDIQDTSKSLRVTALYIGEKNRE